MLIKTNARTRDVDKKTRNGVLEFLFLILLLFCIKVTQINVCSRKESQKQKKNIYFKFRIYNKIKMEVEFGAEITKKKQTYISNRHTHNKTSTTTIVMVEQ